MNIIRKIRRFLTADLERRVSHLESIPPPPLYWDGTPMRPGDRVCASSKEDDDFYFIKGTILGDPERGLLLRTTMWEQPLHVYMLQLQGRAVWKKL